VAAGYSGTPLVRKLGLKPGQRVYVDVDPKDPVSVDLQALELDDPAYSRRLPQELDSSLLFTSRRSRLENRLPFLFDRTVPDGQIWVCWPKKASKQPTDVDENLVREFGLETGLVDVKVAAIDDTWSGLKFVRRLRDR